VTSRLSVLDRSLGLLLNDRVNRKITLTTPKISIEEEIDRDAAAITEVTAAAFELSRLATARGCSSSMPFLPRER
jgi:hypothetical protein